MLSWLIFSALAADIHTAVDGDDHNVCHTLQPCSFKVAQNIAKSEDVVYVKGSYMEDPKQLKRLSALFNAVLSKGAIMMSGNMTVNGSLYKSSQIAFIVVQSTESSRIHQWHFTGFNMAIACFRTVEKGVISETVFSNNHIRGGIGMLSFGVGKCKLEQCVVTENSVCESSLIAMFSTHLYLELTSIERNYVEHNSSQALMFAVNSVCEYTNTTFRHNHSPNAPLHQFDYRSIFGFWNCSFEDNKHMEVMLCDGTCEFNFTNCTIARNMGSFLTTSPGSMVSFNESLIVGNDSGRMPLFDIPGSRWYVLHPCVFVNNTGSSIFDMRGASGTIGIKHAKFKRNVMQEFVIAADDASVEISHCKFHDNVGAGGTLAFSGSEIKVANSKFGRNGRHSLFVSGGSMSSMGNSFKDTIGGSGSSVTSVESDVSMVGDAFIGDVVGGHLSFNGTFKLYKLRFTGERANEGKKIRHACRSCRFGDDQDVEWRWYIFIGVSLTVYWIALFWRPVRRRNVLGEPARV